MSTTTESRTTPQITILSRVASIPLVSLSLETIDHTLSSYAITRSPYIVAKELSSTAFKYSEPIQVRLAPLIVQADGFANKAVDAVESRYPYPFRAKPSDVSHYVRQRRQSATEYVHHSIDEKVKIPAVSAVQDFDHRFAPIVDYIEVAVNRIGKNNESNTSVPDPKYQYQRAFCLTRDLTKNLYGYSNEQFKYLQQHSVVLQLAAKTAHSISELAFSSLANAQDRVHELSNNMIAELQKLQALTASLSASLQTTTSTVQNSVSQIQSHMPPQIQQLFSDLSNNLSSAATDLSDILAEKDIPLQEKFRKLASRVQSRVVPLLGSVTKAVSEVLHSTGTNTPAEPQVTDTTPTDKPGEGQASPREVEMERKSDSIHNTNGVVRPRRNKARR